MPYIEFPVNVLKPGSMFSADIQEWYSNATAKIKEFMDDGDPDISTVTDVWTAKSMLRYAAAMSLVDQELAAEFMRDNPLPSIEDLIDLARRTSPNEPIIEALRQLFVFPENKDNEIVVVNNTSYSDLVMKDGQGEMCVKTAEGWKTLYPVLPPRPIVPNPEYIPTIEPFFSTASIFQQVPRIGYPETAAHKPCLVVLGGSLWLSYLTDQGEKIAVVEFTGYIEHQESRIGTLLEGHPYFNAGLTPRAFNELSESIYIKYWNRFSAKHWVVNFADRTIDVIAQSARLVEPLNESVSTFSCIQAAVLASENTKTQE